MSLLVGIDLGTSGIKAALFDADTFQVIKIAGAEVGVSHPTPGFTEQNPEDWILALEGSVRQLVEDVDPADIKGVGIDAQMHGIVCVGRDLQPVHPAIIWADGRSYYEVDSLVTYQNQHRLSGLPGRPSTGFAASTLRWLSRFQPEVLAKTYQILHPKDYLRLYLTGNVGTDYSDASAGWLLNVESGEWIDNLAAFCGLRLNQLPSIQPSHQIGGEIRGPVARTTGLKVGTPVTVGAADLPAQAVGHGVTEPGDILVTVGTGGQVLTPLAKPVFDQENKTYTFFHAVPDRWYRQAAMLSAGLSLRWLRDILGLTQDPNAYANLSRMAASVPAGANGLLFLPYLAGERTPYNDPNASGTFIGLKLHHTAAHMARAVMEGVGFALLDCLNLLTDGPGSNDRPIILSGGISQSEIWRQIVTDIWQTPIEAINDKVPRACLGSAILAAVGTGSISSFEQARMRLIETSDRSKQLMLLPNQTNVYQDRYAQYKRLYPLLSDEMKMLRGSGVNA